MQDVCTLTETPSATRSQSLPGHLKGVGSAVRQFTPTTHEGTFHSLRHYYATALISAGADPTDVQKALRHSSLRITLETYVHWWPKKQRRRNIVGTALREATTKRKRDLTAQDQG